MSDGAGSRNIDRKEEREDMQDLWSLCIVEANPWRHAPPGHQGIHAGQDLLRNYNEAHNKN